MIFIIKSIFFIALFIFITMLITTIIIIKKRQVINRYKDNFKKVYEDRIKKKELILLYEGTIEKKTFIDKIDDIIENSAIRITLPFLTSEVFLCITVLLSVIITFIFNVFIFRFFIFDLLIFIAALFVPYLILKQITKIIYNQIDNQILGWINTISNLCISNNDIVTIIDKASQYMKTPLKQYSETFVFEARQGFSIKQAFKNFEDKVENRRLKQIIRNLSVCSKHDADYKKTIDKSRIVLKSYFVEKERRKKDLREGRKDICITIGMGIGLFLLVLSFQESFANNLFGTLPGNLILGFNICILFFSVFKMISLDDFNY